MQSWFQTPQPRAGILQGVLLVLPITMAVLGLAVLSPVLPNMQAAFQSEPHADVLAPLALTLPGLLVALLASPAGALVDRFGRRKTLIVALITYAIVGSMPMFLSSLTHIIVSRAALGATEAVIVTASTTLIGDYFQGAEREKWLAYQTSLASVSAVVLFAIGGALGNLGWRAPFAIYAISLLFAISIMLWTWEPQAAGIQDIQHAGSPTHFPWRTMTPLAVLAALSGVAFFIVPIELSFLLTQRYNIREPGAIGMYIAISSLSVPVGTYLYRRSTQLPALVLLQIAFVVIGTTFVLMNYATTPALLLPCLIVNQLGCGILLPTLVVWAMAHLPFEFRGRGTGLFMTGWWIGQFLTPIVIAILRKEVGTLPGALQAVGFACVAVSAAAFITQRFSLKRTANI